MTDANHYPANVFWSEEDNGYIAVAPDLPGCSAFGDSRNEAVIELQSAIAAWIEAAHVAGNPIPEPSRPAMEDMYSGKVLLRMPKALHAQIAKESQREDVSLNQYMVFLLTSAITRETVKFDYGYNISNITRAFHDKIPSYNISDKYITDKYVFFNYLTNLKPSIPEKYFQLRGERQSLNKPTRA